MGDIIRRHVEGNTNEYDVIYETKRTTVHFTINGLVANSPYGNFDYPFIILEPLKHHINEESLVGLRVEDTYFNDDIALSNESIIMIDESKFDEVKDFINFDKYKIILYKGDRIEALKKILNELGYPYFRVCDHGYSEGLDEENDAYKMYMFISEYAEEHNISQDKHFYSPINIADALNREKNHKEMSKKHLLYILDNGLVDKNLSDKIKMLLESDSEYDLKPYLEKLISSIDLEELKRLTKEFNEQEIERIKNIQNCKQAKSK